MDIRSLEIPHSCSLTLRAAFRRMNGERDGLDSRGACAFVECMEERGQNHRRSDRATAEFNLGGGDFRSVPDCLISSMRRDAGACEPFDWDDLRCRSEEQGHQGPGGATVGVPFGTEGLAQDGFFEAGFAQIGNE